MKRFLPIFLMALLGLASCEKALFKSDQASTGPFVNFDYLWQEVDKKYSYFELKNLDWQQIRTKYRSRLTSTTTDEELFQVLGGMINELRDDHSNLNAPFNFSRYNLPLKSKPNFNWRTIEEHYLPNIWYTGAFAHDFLDSGRVGYIRYGSFLSNFSEAELNFVMNRYANTKGIILDLRSNGGGSVFNVMPILGRFVEAPVTAGYFITRNGPNHSEFGPRENFQITPTGTAYTKKVMVLMDRGSYSATTLFAIGTKALPNVVLVGDTTGGGGGLPNGGQLPNGWSYRFSVSQLLDLNGDNYAEKGVPPDIIASFDWTDLTKDEILERALAELK